MRILVFIGTILQKLSSLWSYANCYVIAKNEYPCKYDWLNKGKCSGRGTGTGWWDKLPCCKCPFYQKKDEV